MKKEQRKSLVDFFQEMLDNPDPYTLGEQMQATMILQLEAILTELNELKRSGQTIDLRVGNAMGQMAQDWADFLRDNRR